MREFDPQAEVAKLVDTEQCLIIGHRGAAALKPENTLPSFGAGIEAGCKMLELDVHRLSHSKTSTPLAVIHDEQLKRTTGDKRLVSELSPADLTHIDAGDGAGIPTLEQVIELAQQSDKHVWLNVELKGADTAHPTHQCLQQRQFNRVLISSFDHQQLHTYRALDPNAALAPLFHHWQDNVLQVAGDLDASSVNLSKSITTRARVGKIRDAGFAVCVYTVNSIRLARKLYGWGVNGIFTDNPVKICRNQIVR